MLLKILFILSGLLVANIGAASAPAPAPIDNVYKVQNIEDLLQKIVDVNLLYKDKFHNIISNSTLEQQTPYATVLMCSDSRVGAGILTGSPKGDMFLVRNIGNQLSTAYGSIEYGVNHLNTKLLLVVGHSGCGAVKAAMQDYSDESVYIKNELDSLKINPKDSLNENLIKNINNQIQNAAKVFKDKMISGEVLLIGMLYDMHDDFGYGHGQIILVNVNTVTDPKHLLENKYIKSVKNLKIYGVH